MSLGTLPFAAPRTKSNGQAPPIRSPDCLADAIAVAGPVYRKHPVTGTIIGNAFVKVTPEIAQRVIGENYRKLRDHRVVFYARQMSGIAWKLTPQGLIFYADGSRADGDHRFNAIILSGTSQYFEVTWGWPTDISPILDGGLPRNQTDFIRAVFGKDWNSQTIAAAKILGFGLTNPGGLLIPNEVIADLCMLLEEPIGFATEALLYKTRSGLSKGEIIAVVAAASLRMDREKIRRFCEGLVTGLNMNPGYEQVALRARISIQERQGKNDASCRSENIAVVSRALSLFDAQEERQVIRPKGKQKNRLGLDIYDVSVALALPGELRADIDRVVAPVLGDPAPAS